MVKAGLMGIVGLTSIAQTVTDSVAAEKKPVTPIKHLILALTSVNHPVCNAVADRLLLLKEKESNYDLHLRSAELNGEDVELIATAIEAVNAAGGPSLQSFSMSFNPELTDQGVLTLIRNLPPSLTEIGLVQCGLGDQAGEPLVAWAAQLPKLHWLCVEHNAFSDQTKERFVELGRKKANLLVIV